jgi:hypothetical protein
LTCISADAAAAGGVQVEQLKSENLEAWQTKYALEGEMAAAKAQLEGWQQQSSSMQQVCRRLSYERGGRKRG